MGKSKKSEKKSKKKHKTHDREKRKKSKKSHKDLKKVIAEQLGKQKIDKPAENPKDATAVEDEQQDFAIPLDLMNNKSHAPETAAEFQKRQSYIRRVTDPVTGRVRLIKGDGEVLEEIVTKTKHQEINKAATQADGAFFADKTVGKHKRTSRK